MKRREFIGLLGRAAAAWPAAASAQAPAPAVIGALSSGSADDSSRTLTALLEGLRDAGYVEGRNLVIEYRFADNHYDRLPSLASELVRLGVDAIWTGGGGGPDR
jgi:putative ABC transport system substrate-binding protein